MKAVQRNHNLDLLKIILSFFVVAAHTLPSIGFSGFEGATFYGIHGLARLTVPIFLLLSGYFLRNHLQNKEHLYKYGKRIFILFIVWQLIYFPLLIKFYNDGVVDKIRLINDAIYGCGHLWYLIATVEGVFLLYLVRNFKVQHKFIIAISLILIGYVYELLFDSGRLANHEWLSTFYLVIGTARNFLFYAFPYLLLGTLYEHWKNYAEKLKILILPLLVCLFAETYFYLKLPVPILNIYITSLPLCLLLLHAVLVSKKQIKINIKQNFSLGIYLCHFYAVYYMYDKFPATTFGLIWAKYFIICILAIILWFILDKINKKFPIFF